MTKLKNILYVDDDADDRQFFIDAIGNIRIHVNVDTAEDGYDALGKLRLSELPLCFFVDINMPRMNGIEFLRKVKSEPAYRSIPAFILSTALSADNARDARDLGAAALLLKQTTIQGLENVLRNCFKTHFHLSG